MLQEQTKRKGESRPLSEVWWGSGNGESRKGVELKWSRNEGELQWNQIRNGIQIAMKKASCREES